MSPEDPPVPVKIMIADDHPLYRDGVARTLRESGQFEVVAEVGTAAEAAEAAVRHRPALALLDISMPGSGIRAAQSIAAAVPGVRIVMLTASESDDHVMEALKAGAAGYVLKGVGGRELVAVLSDVAQGGSYVTPSLAARLLTALKAPRPQPPRGADLIEDLTKREEDILRLVSRGLSNKEVGRTLDLQEKTVKHYMTNILQKLQVRNRTEAAVLAREAWGKPG
jgi:DNA-binding NarL/FixJ family response regulator